MIKFISPLLAVLIFAAPSVSLAAALPDHPWCRIYDDAGGDSYQERYVFSKATAVDVRIYSFVNGARKDLIVQSQGSYKVIGSKLNLNVGGQIVNSTFRIDSGGRLYIVTGKDESIYETCN